MLIHSMCVHMNKLNICMHKGWFTIRRKACVHCAAYVVTQRNVSMGSSEIDVKMQHSGTAEP